MQATVAQQVWRDGLGERAGLAARCFPRRETRAMLMGVAQANCWTLAEALGHGDPHRLQHFLARAVWNADPEVRLRHGQLQPGQELRDPDRRPGRAVPRHPPGT